MDIVVKCRKAEVSEKFRQHASEKLGKVDRFDHKIIRLEVEVSEERNPRLSDSRQRVEVTCLSKGPVIRAEAAASDAYVALDLAVDKLAARLRRAADKRRVHHGARTSHPRHPSSASVPAAAAAVESPTDAVAAASDLPDQPLPPPADQVGDVAGEHGIVVREKVFEARPMTLDDALFNMELVGHDFYLFADADTGLPSVVYRRKGYDYGVIRLKP